MTKKSFFYLKYIEGCTPKLKKFNTKKELNEFIKTFVVSDDDCLDFWFQTNNLTLLDEYWNDEV